MAYDCYYNESWQMLEERFANDVAEASKDNVAANARIQYVWDPENRDCIDAPAEAHGSRRYPVTQSLLITPCQNGRPKTAGKRAERGKRAALVLSLRS